ncbi:hypothetical protein ACOSQ2_020614 [Xanthoceras sorbifolium]
MQAASKKLKHGLATSARNFGPERTTTKGTTTSCKVGREVRIERIAAQDIGMQGARRNAVVTSNKNIAADKNAVRAAAFSSAGIMTMLIYQDKHHMPMPILYRSNEH